MLFAGVSFAEGKTSPENANKITELQQKRGRQFRQERRYRQRERRYNDRRLQTFYRTRYVWRRGQRYREVYRVRILPNGRRQVRLVSRKKIRSYRNDRRYRRCY